VKGRNEVLHLISPLHRLELALGEPSCQIISIPTDRAQAYLDWFGEKANAN
jgi:hypothetical protein